MNKELIELLSELDSSTEKQNEHSISSQINAVAGEDESLEAQAERIAFGFCENYESRDTGWGTYFGPMMVWTNDNGELLESPSISLVTEKTLNYWTERSDITKNAFMRSRYAGLVWDFTRKVLNKNPDHKIAITYIESLIITCDNDLCKHPSDAIQKITRAYKVSCNLNNPDLIKKCIVSAISLEERVGDDDKPGLWGFCFELFILGKEKLVTDEQRNLIIAEQENRLTRTSKDHSPWTCESAGIPLATYYRSLNQQNKVKRVIEIVGQCFESACEGLAAMQASSWYQHVHDIYISFNFKEMAENVAKKISEIGPDVVDSMQSFSHEMEIPKEKLDAYLDDMTSGGLDTSLKRIAIEFIPKKDEIKKQVLELAKNNPLSFLMTKTLQDHKGRPVATIGGIEDDIEGNTIHQLSQNLQIDSFFLRHSLNKVKEQYKPSVDDIADYIFQSPIFEDSKKDIIRRGLTGFVEEDYLTTIHLLVPNF